MLGCMGDSHCSFWKLPCFARDCQIPMSVSWDPSSGLKRLLHCRLAQNATDLGLDTLVLNLRVAKAGFRV